jgi:putative transcriptional regulator
MVTNLVNKWRLAKGVSKAHMARYVGVDRSYVTKLEQGKMQPSGEMMFRIAEYLGQPLEVVFQHAPVKSGGHLFSAQVMPESQTTISPPCAATKGNS